MKIRRRQYESGRVVFQLNIAAGDGGKRSQKVFDSMAAAKRAMQLEERRRQRHGALAREVSPVEMAELMAAREKVVAAGGSVGEAVEFWLKHAARVRDVVPVSELVRRFISAKKDAGRSARYVAQLAVSLNSLARRFPLTSAPDLTADDVLTWLNGGGWAAKTWNNYLGDVSALFEWGKRKGFARLNPAAGIDRRRLAESEIVTLTVDECAVLLSSSARLLADALRADWRGGGAAAAKRARLAASVLAFTVAGLFGGLRPAELGRLHWAAVDVDAGHIIVGGALSKTRRRRVVDLSENARAWLRLIPADLMTGKLCGPGFDDAWRVFRRELGWDVARCGSHVSRPVAPMTRGRWLHNCARHTFASMHYARHNDEARLQAQMGHESAAMLHRHYRALKTPAEAALFWTIEPHAFASAGPACARPARPDCLPRSGTIRAGREPGRVEGCFSQTFPDLSRPPTFRR